MPENFLNFFLSFIKYLKKNLKSIEKNGMIILVKSGGYGVFARASLPVCKHEEDQTMQSLNHVLSAAKEIIKNDLSSTAYRLWIAPVEPMRMDGSLVLLHLNTDFQKNILLTKYLDRFYDAFLKVLGFPVDIEVITEEEIERGTLAPLEEHMQIAGEQKRQLLEESYLDGEYECTFDTFIVGSSNTFAYAACKAVAKKQTGAYNPLFIYGPSGLGKTHLLMAISHELKKRNPDLNVMYVNGEAFTNEFIKALEDQTTGDFHNKYRKVDYLLMDDIQFISGKTQTQEEFFYTFNELHQVGKQIVLTSDRPPKDIKTLEDRLRTRFEWGLLADISPPEYETRVAIVRRKAELLHIDIPDDVAYFVAKNLKNNIRQLEGAVKKFKAYKLLANSSPSLSMAQSVIRDILNDDQPTPVTVEKIIKEVAKSYGVSEEDIRSTRRQAQIARARHVAIFIVREITQLSYDEIGQQFSNRDHSTITYSLKQVEELMKTNSEQREMIEDIIKNIRNW